MIDYLKYTSSQESPTIFHFWCAASLMAATLERSCWLDLGYFRVYPNLYVILVAESAIARKSSAIHIASAMGKEAVPEMPLSSQKCTTEALIQTFKEQYEEREVSASYIVSDELAVFLGEGAEDSSLIALLTKVFDCPNVVDYRTIGRGTEEGFNICVNMLAGTTNHWMKSSLPPGAVGGGFTSRVVFVYGSDSGKRVPFPKLTPQQKEARKALAHDLATIRKTHRGRYELTKDAREWYSTWYVDVSHPERADHTLSGYYGRRHITLLKTAMVVAAARREELVIREKDLEDSLAYLRETERHLPGVMQQVQASAEGEKSLRIYALIERAGTIDHSNLLRRVHHICRARELQEIIDSLDEGGLIKVEITKHHGRRYSVDGKNKP